MRRNTTIFVFLAATILLLFGCAGIAYAQLPFGGFNTIFIPCTATPGVFLVYIVPVGASPPNLLYTPVTIPYSHYAFLVPSVPVLGLYAPVPAPCVVLAPTPVVIGVGFPVIEEGTGL